MTPTGETPFKLAYGSEAVISTEVHMANHRVMKYQNEDNEEQLCLNLDLIDEVRMNVEQRTVRYKNLMARQYDAMVKLRHFNIGDVVLKRVSLATRNLAYRKLGPNWKGPYKVINCKRQGSYYLEALDGRKLEHPCNVEQEDIISKISVWTSTIIDEIILNVVTLDEIKFVAFCYLHVFVINLICLYFSSLKVC